MIDSRATGNFISNIFAQVRKVPTKDKEEPYQLQMANGSNLSSRHINREMIPLDVAIQRHYKKITFDVVRMANYYIILGAPWLKKQNPLINWKTGVLIFGETRSVTSSGRTHRQRSIVHKKLSRRTTTECNTAISNKDNLKRGSNSMDTSKG